VTQKKTFVFEMKTKGSVVVSTRKFFPCWKLSYFF
jgi:hypothetical protein